jgi:hypothetical protein
MPSLTKEDQKALIGPVKDWKCQDCGCPKVRQYCRQCDEFWFECECGVTNDEYDGDESEPHEGHRAYRYIDGKVVADDINDGKGDVLRGRKKVKTKGKLTFDLRPRPSE